MLVSYLTVWHDHKNKSAKRSECWEEKVSEWWKCFVDELVFISTWMCSVNAVLYTDNTFCHIKKNHDIVSVCVSIYVIHYYPGNELYMCASLSIIILTMKLKNNYSFCAKISSLYYDNQNVWVMRSLYFMSNFYIIYTHFSYYKRKSLL